MNRFAFPVMTAKNGYRIFSVLAGSAYLNPRVHGEGDEGQAPSPPVPSGHPVHMAGPPSWISKSLNIGGDPEREQPSHQLTIAGMEPLHLQ